MLDPKSIECVRKRPGMYFGTVREPGLERFIYELVDNVVDCYLRQEATFVHVKLDGRTITISDDGLGLPFDEPSDVKGMSFATQLLTHFHTGRSVDNHAPHVHRELLGVGIAPLNIASSHLVVRSWRSGLRYEQTFSQGVARNPEKIIQQGDERGTSIELIPDAELFGSTKPRPSVIRQALFETAHLFSGLKVGFNEECFCAPDGLKDMGILLFKWCSLYRYHPWDYRHQNIAPFHTRLDTEDIFIEAVVLGKKEAGVKKIIHSWVNGARTPQGGSHVQGFKAALKSVKWKPALILIHVVMHNPEFAGPVRDKLDVPYIRDVIKNALLEPLHQYKMSRQNEK